MSERRIGALIGLHASRIHYYLCQFSIPRRRRDANEGRFTLSRDELGELYQVKEMTVAEIAEEVGVSHKTVTYWMRKYGLPTRTRSDGRKGSLNTFYGRTHTPAVRAVISEKALGREISDETRVKMRLASREKWADPDWKERTLIAQREAMKLRPTAPERHLMEVCEANGFPFRYTGDGGLWISGLNPDFAHLSERKLIEVFGDYWHGPERNPGRYHREDVRRAIFRRFRYDLLVVWEHELRNESEVIDKIRRYAG